jgi:plasmid stability protein
VKKMPDVLIRDVPTEILDNLKRKASRHGRSLQQELAILLEREGREPAVDYAERARLMREKIARYAPNQSDSVDLIREDRER